MPGGDRRFEIRVAGEGDIDAVLRCLASAFEPYRASYTPAAFLDTVPDRDGLARRMREMTVLIAETAGDGPPRVVGTIAHQVSEPGTGHLRGMAVLPEEQGREMAGSLLAAAEAALRAAGCRRVTLDTTRPLERAIRFYVRSGYRATGAVSDFHGMPLYEYEKRLA